MDQQTTAIATTLASQAAEKTSNFISEVIGDNLKNAVGLMGADWLLVKREENLEQLRRKKDERLSIRGIADTVPVSLSIAIPLIRGAADESRDEIQDLWAALLAAALDPNRGKDVTRFFIDVLQKMEPWDAKVFQAIWTYEPDLNKEDTMAARMGASLNSRESKVLSCFANLVDLGLVKARGPGNYFHDYYEVVLTARGRELIELLQD
ncbi:Abi-alpha family protein [Asticcacaulis endophyticus]|uniref:DUF4393 domain-containing protein n=1 Tax=Asticcacaulis endophyticus TaxID=1395890 RepID=A0A918Q408_9CAUL|nr:Abi-alpha family protein [Asticcacaulis endophyticus]GGZ32173.1 hypothetical protein GCM10011273_17810 [Asticcacaulis endophyticus]